MTRSGPTLHIRTGDPGLADAIDAWLRASAVEPVICVDAYEACVHLLKRAEDVPELVFVGVDWLAPDEQEVIRYVRDTWPAVGMVVYGAPLAPGVADTPLIRVCAARSDLLPLLAAPPAELVDRFAREGAPTAIGAPPSVRLPLPSGDAVPLRDVLTREELSALLEEDDR